MKIIGTGISGLVGSRIQELLTDFEFEDISRKTGTDITDRDAVIQRVKDSGADIILHLAAKADVDGAELEKDLGEDSESWKINVIGTENIIKAAEEYGKRLIAISTDFVFDGEQVPTGGYTEEDIPSPLGWYGQTKYEAEKRVEQSIVPWVIARIAYPYRANYEKKDFFRAMKGRLDNNQPIAGVTDHKFSPTFIDGIAHALEALIQNNSTGIYHVTGSEHLSPYEAAITIAEVFDLDKNLISQTTRAEYFKDKAPRPLDLSMNNDKIKQLGAQMKGFREGLEEVKKQLG